MNAGVLRGKFKTGSLEDVIRIYKDVVLSGYAKVEGARGGQLWLNRQTGDSLSIGFYDSEEAAKAFQPIADQALAALRPHVEAEPTGREFFELGASTMSEAVAVIEKSFAAFNAHDAEALARLTAPDYEAWAAGSEPIRGVQAAKEYNEAWFRAFPDCHSSIDRIIGQGSRVVIEGTFTGTHTGPLQTSMGEVAATGRKVSGPFVEVVEVDRGLMRSSRLYYDRMELAVQIGVMPSGTGTETA